MKIIFNDEISKEAREKILQAIKDNGGYCPCRIEKTKDNLCQCKEFRDAELIFQQKKRYVICYCGLYKKVEED